MADIVPDVLPRSATAGERRVHALLRRLPDDCVVYYEPMVRDRCPDFVVIAPDLGLLVIEVKGWRAHDIVAADTHSVQVRYQGRMVRHRHPLRQAREYMFALMDRCRIHPAITPLLSPDGFFENRFLFPFGHCAVLTNISDAQLNRHPGGDLSVLFPAHSVLSRDVLLAWEACPGATDLIDALRPCFAQRWPFSKLNERQVDALRAIIHPEIVLELPLDYTVPSGGADAAPSDATLRVAEVAGDSLTGPQRTYDSHARQVPTAELRTLDLCQENHARAIGDGHRILSGVAGSGKTLILIARARLVSARNPAARFLVLCYNMVLASFLRAKLLDCANICVSHFDEWAAANHVRRRWSEEDESLGERLLESLTSGVAPDARRFEGVLVDEAQDLEPSWFRCALAALRDPEHGDLLIVGDGNQRVYRRGRVSWKSLGISAAGRTISERFRLDVNYRNSREIALLARQFASASQPSVMGDEDTMPARPLLPESCGRAAGFRPLLFRETDRAGECRRVVALVRDLLAGHWNGQSLRRPLRPEQIGILYRCLRREDQALFAEFLVDLAQAAPVCWLNAKDDPEARTRVCDSAVKVQTIHAAKGLQYRAVILLWAGDLPYLPSASWHDKAAERRLFYVALTRAEDFLALTAPLTSHASFLGEVASLLTERAPRATSVTMQPVQICATLERNAALTA
jgi:hypothetical protein